MNLGDYLKQEKPEKYFVLKIHNWGIENLTDFAAHFLRWTVTNVEIVQECNSEGKVETIHNIYIGDWE